ncbi:hypothetical protein CR513_19355, partial [Mucuna pruriens]
MKIIRILSPQEWDQPLYKERSFSRTFDLARYSYYDYTEAWSQVLLTNPEKHSWFIWFKKGTPLKFPKWFIKWYYHNGATPTIFPPKILKAYEVFKEKSTFVTGYRLISFVASQAITWIFSWEYVIIQLYEGIDLKIITLFIKKTKIDSRVSSNYFLKRTPTNNTKGPVKS